MAGETAVGVDESERLYVSVNGGAFVPVAHPNDPQGVRRAAGVAVSNNLVAFLVKIPVGGFSDVLPAYAVLP